MWEAIRKNRRRSYLLISVMGLVLLALGLSIGIAFDPRTGAWTGTAVAMGIWLVLWLAATKAGDSILLSSVGARRIDRDDAPQLWNVVEEMRIASGLSTMPRVYVIDDNALNAFAVGSKPEKAAVAVTSGLLRKLNRDELQGVIAHEIGHIHNLDVRFMTLAGVMMGSIVLISDVFLRSLFFGGRRRRSRGTSSGGGQLAAIMLIVAIALAILGPIIAQLLYFACSRRREYLADASSARFTRYPEGLASALERISKRAAAPSDGKAARVVAPMYIINPLQARSAFSLTSTHPPTEKRVAILRSMGGQAGFAAYEAAYRQATGSKRSCIGVRTLDSADAVATRPPTPIAESKKDAIERSRLATDLVDRMAGYLFLACACGVRIKVPPNSTRKQLKCPRCGRQHEIPTAELAALAGAAAAGKENSPSATKTSEPPMRYRRSSDGWESFRCRCGHTVQLSPSFKMSFLHCPKCRRRIEIAGG